MNQLTFLFILYLLQSAAGLCFFPAEYQGIFASQTVFGEGKRHVYSKVTVLPDAIPIWGVCESRTGNTVILHDSTGGRECFRCFHLYLRSPNVIQVYTELRDRCFDDEESAVDSCSSIQDIQALRVREIMLYKTRSFSEDGLISRETCPFVGRFRFSYGAFDGKRRSHMCLDLSSHMSTCPRASQLKLNFRQCTFGELDLHLECLGAWTGLDDITYVALYDPDVTRDNRQQRYRCGMYHKSASGRVALSLSADSSCHRQLISPWQGFESFSLTPIQRPIDTPTTAQSCTFPSWVQGDWQDLKFTGDRFEYRDQGTDQVYEGFCLSEEAPVGERFAVYSVNQCGKESFSCMWLKSRDESVMELIITPGESGYNNVSSLCSDDRMWKRAWLTQGRTLKSSSTCPISGEFEGVLPDDKTLCAKLTSDCARPDFMQHTVFPCANRTLPYEAAPQETIRTKVYTKPRVTLSSRTRNSHAPRIVRRRRRSSLLQPPPWAFVGEADKSGRLFILSTEPVRQSNDRRGRRVYMVEGGLEPPPPINNNNPFVRNFNSNDEVKGNRMMEPRDSSRELLDPGKSRKDPDNRIDRDAFDNERFKRDKFQMDPGDEKERYYQCLGQWKEGGITYIYTWRRDVYKYECFAGVSASENQVYLMEAGATCHRGLQPLARGMKITKKNKCSEMAGKMFPGGGAGGAPISVHEVSNRVEGYDKRTGSRWRALGENQSPLSSRANTFSIQWTASAYILALSAVLWFFLT